MRLPVAGLVGASVPCREAAGPWGTLPNRDARDIGAPRPFYKPAGPVCAPWDAVVMGIAVPADVWVRLAADQAPAQLPHWLPAPNPPSSATAAELAEANDPRSAFRARCGNGGGATVWQGRVAYRRPMRHVGWLSHRDWVYASRLVPRPGAD
jgi:hypothetical protein